MREYIRAFIILFLLGSLGACTGPQPWGNGPLTLSMTEDELWAHGGTASARPRLKRDEFVTKVCMRMEAQGYAVFRSDEPEIVFKRTHAVRRGEGWVGYPTRLVVCFASGDELHVAGFSALAELTIGTGAPIPAKPPPSPAADQDPRQLAMADMCAAMMSAGATPAPNWRAAVVAWPEYRLPIGVTDSRCQGGITGYVGPIPLQSPAKDCLDFVQSRFEAAAAETAVRTPQILVMRKAYPNAGPESYPAVFFLTTAMGTHEGRHELRVSYTINAVEETADSASHQVMMDSCQVVLREFFDERYPLK